MSNTIVILGSGGFAREAYFHLRDAGISSVFFDTHSSRESVVIAEQEVEVVKKPMQILNHRFIACIGDPKARQAAVRDALEAGLKPAPTFIHPKAITYDVQFGVGGIVTPFCIITTHVKIGNYALINWHTSVGHDTTIGDFVTAYPGSRISGNVAIGDRVLIGAGAFIKQGHSIASDVIIGAQAAVVKDITKAGTYSGVPARTH